MASTDEPSGPREIAMQIRREGNRGELTMDTDPGDFSVHAATKAELPAAALDEFAERLARVESKARIIAALLAQDMVVDNSTELDAGRGRLPGVNNEDLTPIATDLHVELWNLKTAAEDLAELARRGAFAAGDPPPPPPKRKPPRGA